MCDRDSGLTSICEQALLVLDTDGGRLAVKYNSFARKDCREHVKHHRARLVVATMQHVRNHLAMSACNPCYQSLDEGMQFGLTQELWPTVKQQVAFEKRVPFSMPFNVSVAVEVLLLVSFEVINKLPKPSATRSDVDVAVIDDYTVIFQVVNPNSTGSMFMDHVAGLQ